MADAVPSIKNLINLPACPANVENLTSLLVYFLTYHDWPPLDSKHRPLFAYGKTIHDNCERRAHFDAGQYVEAWGDEAHRNGECLYKMGCKGPVTLPELPRRSVERGHELADRLRAPVHRLRGAGLLGPHDALLPAPHRRARLRPGLRRRQGRLARDGRGRGAAFAAHGLVQIGIRRRGAQEEKAREPRTKQGGSREPHRRRSGHAHRRSPAHRSRGRWRHGQGRLVVLDHVPRHRAHPEGARSARRVGLHAAHLRRVHHGARHRLGARGRERHRRQAAAERPPAAQPHHVGADGPGPRRALLSPARARLGRRGLRALRRSGQDVGARRVDQRLAALEHEVLHRRARPREGVRRSRSARARSPTPTGAIPRTSSRPRRTSWPWRTTSRRSTSSASSSACTRCWAARTPTCRASSSAAWRRRSIPTSRRPST